ncbi:LysM peptidoglycan-binding domain-containing protein [Spiribacter halobius]|uniref:Peptidoglycan-binding protein n=1 Tax=Sediminicurvatus halobius TaxID=2182432 RepID=A0A2U2MZC7_9GAMM|nr:LysM peptidoglycan-binding domain-containing protein [Spiribacter halobius]PWG62230.1 peptidoglycan-binding protein [Spiribacter halobius]UEX78139.1 LysM peptidoglycan-binding domain-containing protein [Spiribacter halobius]
MFRHTIRRALCVLAFAAVAPALAQNGDALRDDHPERYTVQPGDTLWGISGRFLNDPWYWPEIWYENPEIDNPHLIYPGDVIRLTVVDGEPRLTVQRGGGTVKLSPQVREQSLDQAVQTIPISAIRPFLTGDRVVGREVLDEAPYIVAGGEERVLGARGDTVYARGLPAEPARGWSVVREHGAIEDPETGEVLGYEARRLGEVRLEREGDPATFRIAESLREIRAGDRLLVTEQRELQAQFTPRAPERSVEAVIVSARDRVSQIGQYDVVILNRGSVDGLEPGHVLEVFKRGREVVDRFAEDEEIVTLPAEKAGELIIFRTAEQLSFGLVMEASRAMGINDLARSP